MATIVVSIIIIALIVIGGMTMSQGILTSADTTALSVEKVSVREGKIMRTELNGVSATLPSSDNLQVTIENTGQLKLASFSKWDYIVEYYDASDNHYVKWLPYSEGTLDDDEWQYTGIFVSGQPEAFEPNILNPEEQLALEAKLNPAIGYRAVSVAVATPSGVTAAIVCGPPVLTAHSDNTTVSGTDYYMLKGWTAADGVAMTERSPEIDRWVTGRWLLYNEDDVSRVARHLYPLSSINEISAATWTVYYRGRTQGSWYGDWRGNASLSIDIIIRQADGTIRQTLATDVAEAAFTDYDTWLTLSATYSFPGYTVVDDTDYLEIAYYGISTGRGPRNWNSYIQLRIDDNNLAEADQTRIEGMSWS